MLLSRSAPRSDRPVDLEAATDQVPEMHAMTGTFADPAQESIFAAQLFQMAFPCHLLLMVLTFVLFGGMTLAAPPGVQVFWGLAAVFSLLGLVGRVLIHKIHDSALAQQIGSWTWTVLLMLGCACLITGYVTGPYEEACDPHRADYVQGSVAMLLLGLAITMTNGTHGMSFGHKTTLIGLMAASDLVVFAVCGEAQLALMLSELSVLAVGHAVVHTAERILRHSYSEKMHLLAGERKQLEERNEQLQAEKQEKQHLAGERKQLEERNEQLQAEKERMMYDMQRPGRPLDDDDDRSAIRRGLRAGPSQPYRLTDPSEAGAPTPSESPPPSLPPGAPSSTSSGSPLMVPSDWRAQFDVVPFSWEEVARRWHAKNPGWGCSALAQTAPSTAATAQLAEEGAAVAHQSGCAQRPATHGPHQPRMFALNRAGAGLGAELHQGTKRLRQTGSCSPAEAAPSEGTQHIEEGPMDQRNQEPQGYRATSFVPPKRPSPPTKAPAPPAKKAYTNPYLVFCRKQRPLLPPSLSNREREKRLSMQWKALSVAEKAVYRAQPLQGSGTLVPAPAPTNTLLPSAQMAGAVAVAPQHAVPVRQDTQSPLRFIFFT